MKRTDSINKIMEAWKKLWKDSEELGKDYDHNHIQDKFESFLLTSLEQVQKDTAEDICKMVDAIEEGNYGTSMDEWKMFKHIRNAIRDKYDPEGFQLEKEEK